MTEAIDQTADQPNEQGQGGDDTEFPFFASLGGALKDLGEKAVEAVKGQYNDTKHDVTDPIQKVKSLIEVLNKLVEEHEAEQGQGDESESGDNAEDTEGSEDEQGAGDESGEDSETDTPAEDTEGSEGEQGSEAPADDATILPVEDDAAGETPAEAPAADEAAAETGSEDSVAGAQ